MQAIFCILSHCFGNEYVLAGQLLFVIYNFRRQVAAWRFLLLDAMNVSRL